MSKVVIICIFFILSPNVIQAYDKELMESLSELESLVSVLKLSVYSKRLYKESALNKSYFKNIDEIITEASRKYNVEKELIKAVIKVESNFNPNALSHKGAAGLMQLMPDTAEEMNVFDRYDVYENIMGGTKYLSLLIKKYGSKFKALWAYNAGPESVEKGILVNETRRYILTVARYYEYYKKDYKNGWR